MSAADTLEEPTLQNFLDANRFGALEKLSDRAESYAVSLREAAYRDDGQECWVLLGKLGLTIIEALRIAEALGRDAEADQ
jgi:hypothetical protein